MSSYFGGMLLALRDRAFLLLMLLAGTSALIGCGTFASGGWRGRADANIEHYRKRDANLTLLNAAGEPLAGAALDIHQTRKSFPFGSAISGGLLRNPQWQAAFKSHFNYAVLENESKWYSNERTHGQESYRQADALLDWCDANGIPVRGHCIFWEADKGPPSWLGALSTPDFRQAIENRLTSAVIHFKGRFKSWDVNNEMLHGTFFIDRLGKEIRPWMSQQAHQIDPATPLFVNDYNILSVDQHWDHVQTDQYVAHIRELLRQGAVINGIGIQGHIANEDILNHPDVIRERLDKVAALGLPIWISEFDVADPDDKVRADKLELVYRSCYSHPAVQGIMMWVFWAGNSWRGPDAALVNQDWTINEEGKRFESLMNEWSTSVKLTTDAHGQAHFRGFHGDYVMTIAASGQPTEQHFTIDPGEGPQIVHITTMN
jgi:GH35 family endo-1,4-beta-xylanase